MRTVIDSCSLIINKIRLEYCIVKSIDLPREQLLPQKHTQMCGKARIRGKGLSLIIRSSLLIGTM